MSERRVPPKRRARGNTTDSTTGTNPLDFKTRLAKAVTIQQATDDGYREVERDDRLDYCDLPMIVERWETKAGWNEKVFARVWALVQVPDQPEPVRIKFRDQGGEMGEQLVEFERCGTRRDVAAVMDAREYSFGPGGMDIGYAYTFRELNADGEHVPPAEEEPASDEPDF